MTPASHPTNHAARRHAIAACVVLVALCPSIALAAAEAEAEKPADARRGPLPVAAVKRKTTVDFQRDILPILKANCLACHNQTAAKANLILESPESMRHGGESGPAVVPKRSSESLLFKAASHRTTPRMPPRENKVNARDLTPEELGLLRLWIDQGAAASGDTAAPIAWRPLPASLNPILAVALSPDGRWAACARANRIFAHDLLDAEPAPRLADPALGTSALDGRAGAAHRDLVESLAFSPDGELLASGSFREAKLWRRPPDARRFSLTHLGNAAVTALAASPDGRWLAVGDNDGRITLSSPTNGATIKRFIAHKGPVHALAFSPDSEWLASGSADRTLAVWPLGRARAFARATTPTPVNAVAWVFGGQQLASGGADHALRLWFVDVPKATLAPLRELTGHEGPITSLAGFPGGTQLLSGGGDGAVRHWNLEEGQTIRVLKHGSPVMSVAVRPDGKRLASAGLNGVARVWDAPSGNALAELRGDRQALELAAHREREAAFATNELAFRKSALETADKETKASAERVKKAVEADAAAEKALAEPEKAAAAAREALAGAERELTALKKELELAAAASKANPEEAASPAVAEAKAAAAKRLEEVKAKQKPAEDQVAAKQKALEPADQALKKAQLSRSNATTELELARKALGTAESESVAGKAALAAAETFRERSAADFQSARERALAAGRPVRTLCFSPDSRFLATAGDDQAVRTWNADSGLPHETFRGHRGAVFAAAFSSAGIISGGGDATAIAWELHPAWTLERTLGTGDAASPIADRVNALCFSPDGALLATGGGEPTRGGEIKLWRTATGQLVRDLPRVHSDAVFCLAFSPDGRFLASGGADRLARIIEVATGRVVRTCEGHAGHVCGVSWNRNGRVLLTAGADGVVKVWDPTTGERKANLGGFSKEVNSVSFIGVTDQALVTSADKTVRIIQLDGKEVRSFAGVNDFVHGGAITPDGRMVVAGSHDGVFHIWKGIDGQSLARFGPSSGSGQ